MKGDNLFIRRLYKSSILTSSCGFCKTELIRLFKGISGNSSNGSDWGFWTLEGSIVNNLESYGNSNKISSSSLISMEFMVSVCYINKNYNYFLK